MSETLYSVTQVSAFLNLHVKTVRRYIQEGRLKATRVGKQYRITAEDLADFTGRPQLSLPGVETRRTVDAHTVIDISAISPDESMRITNTLMAAMQGADPSRTKVDTIYYEESGRLKIVLHSGLGLNAELVKMISVLLNEDAA